MSRNRIVHIADKPTAQMSAPAIPPGFAYCPNPYAAASQQPMSAANFMHQAAYQQALQDARDRAWRAFLDRALFSVWN